MANLLDFPVPCRQWSHKQMNVILLSFWTKLISCTIIAGSIQVHSLWIWHMNVSFEKLECLIALCHPSLHPQLGVNIQTYQKQQQWKQIWCEKKKFSTSTQNGAKHPKNSKKAKVEKKQFEVEKNWVKKSFEWKKNLDKNLFPKMKSRFGVRGGGVHRRQTTGNISQRAVYLWLETPRQYITVAMCRVWNCGIQIYTGRCSNKQGFLLGWATLRTFRPEIGHINVSEMLHCFSRCSQCWCRVILCQKHDLVSEHKKYILFFFRKKSQGVDHPVLGLFLFVQLANDIHPQRSSTQRRHHAMSHSQAHRKVALAGKIHSTLYDWPANSAHSDLDRLPQSVCRCRWFLSKQCGWWSCHFAHNCSHIRPSDVSNSSV